MVYPPDPLAKLYGIWYCGTKENNTDVIRKHNQNLLPHNPSLRKRHRRKKTVILDFYNKKGDWKKKKSLDYS